MDKSTFFSIIVPTYNRAHLIATTIESILSQTYPHFEILIIDDGSTDNTEEIIQKYLSGRVHYYKKINAERSAARNFGTKKAKGDYINWFDSDDIMFPDHLEKAAFDILNYNLPEFFSMGFQYQDENGNVLYTSKYSPNVKCDFYRGNPLAIGAVFVRKNIALSNPFNEDRDLSGSEDYELWLRLAASYPIYTSSYITVGFIHHNERSTITMNNPDRLINRYLKLNHYTTSNAHVTVLLGENLGFFEMKNHLLLAVDLMNSNFKDLAIKYLKIAFTSSQRMIFQRGFFAFIKHYLRHGIS